MKSLSCVRLFATSWTVCSLPGSSVHEIFQARILEWVAISSSRGTSRPRDRTRVSCIVGRHFTVWATREVMLEKAMTTHSSTLAWIIPWTEEPGRLQPLGSQRVRHNWATSLHFTSLQRKMGRLGWLLPDWEGDWMLGTGNLIIS